MILQCQEPVRFLEEEDEKEECEEDFEDFDFLLFDCLLEVRESWPLHCKTEQFL